MKKHLDRESLFFQYRFELETAALFQAYFRAENYRNFNVGAAVLASNGRSYKVFGGANIMNGKGRPKICAEQQAIKYAFLAGYTEILIVTVVGEPQPDKESGLLSHTLHPCDECRKLMKTMYKLPEETLVCTISFKENSATERFTLQGLIKLHRAPATSVAEFFLLYFFKIIRFLFWRELVRAFLQSDNDDAIALQLSLDNSTCPPLEDGIVQRIILFGFFNFAL